MIKKQNDRNTNKLRFCKNAPPPFGRQMVHNGSEKEVEMEIEKG